MTEKQNKSQSLYLILSFLILGLAAMNSYLSLNLWNIHHQHFMIIAIFLASLILWLFVALDWPSLLTIVLLGLIPEIGFSKIFTLSFGNTTFVFLLFIFIVTYSLNQTSVLKRITSWGLNHPWVQAEPWRFIYVMLSIFLTLALVFSPSVLFMFVFPIYEEVCQQFQWDKGNRSASHLLIGIYSTLAIGTAMTPINHVFAITAMGIYQTATGHTITNLQYMSFLVPIGLLLFLFLIFTLKKIFPLDLRDLQLGRLETIAVHDHISLKEKVTAFLFIIMVFMWIVPEMVQTFWPELTQVFKTAGIAFPPLIITILLAVIRIEGDRLIDIPQAMKAGVHWPSLLLVAATLALGAVMANPEIGLVAMINQWLTQYFRNLSPAYLVLIFVAWAGLQTNVSSNLVTVSMVSTLAVSLLGQNDINLAVLVCLIGFMSSLAMMTPPAMPYVAISIGSGWTRSRDCLLMGLWLLIWSVLIVGLLGYQLGSQIL